MTIDYLFEQMDADGDRLINVAEFVRGIKGFTDLKQSVIEQVFRFIDRKGLGLITYDRFKEALTQKRRDFDIINHHEIEAEVPERSKEKDYDQFFLDEIKAWIKRQNISFLDAFKLFDYDFDGQVSKPDLRKALVKLVQINPRDLTKQRIDKLFEILCHSRMPNLQPSDFERLLYGQNECNIDRVARIIGQRMGQRFNSLEEAFKAAGKGKSKVNLSDL